MTLEASEMARKTMQDADVEIWIDRCLPAAMVDPTISKRTPRRAILARRLLLFVRSTS
jgi:hypothetical protein